MEPPEWSVPSSVNATTYFQPVNDEHSAITTMLASLDAGQLAGAKLSANFSDMLMGVNKDGAFPAVKEGLSVGSLNPAQQQLVLAAIKTYVSDAEKMQRLLYWLHTPVSWAIPILVILEILP
jgi:hypothetical protein